MAPPKRAGLLEGPIDIRTEDARWCATADFLAFPAEPLTLGNKGNAIAFLMDGQVTSIAEDNRIGVLTISVVADRAFTIWLVARRVGIAINGRLRARARPMHLSVPWLWLWNTLFKGMVFLLDLGHGDLEDGRLDGVNTF